MKNFAVLSCLCAFRLVFSLYLVAQQPDQRTLEHYFQEGEKALAENRFAEAAKAYEKLSQLDPKTAEVHAKLGLSYYQQGRFADAVPALRRALKLKPGLPNTDTLLAMSLSELGRYAEALPGLEKGFRHPPDSNLKRLIGLQLQRSYVGLQRYYKAAEVALELGRLYPEDPEVLYHTGRLYGDYAYLTMRKLSQVAPESVWMHQAEAEAHESKGHYDLAIREYRKVLAMDPGRPGIHFRIGRTILSQPQIANSQEDALKEFEQELQIDPTNAIAAYEIGEIYRKMGQFDKAQEFFSHALEHYPDFEEARIGLARVLIALNEPQKALPQLEKAILLNPENEVSHYHLSLIYRALGNTAGQEKELGEFRRLRARKPEQQERAQAASGLREVTKQELNLEATP
jgi:tetratricopeptide (TPR) repeat protein